MDYTRKKLNKITKDLRLSDIYRTFHPESKGFSFLSSNGANIEAFPLASDHNLIDVTLAFGNVPRGRGLWKLNTSLLEDKTYSSQIEIFWKEWRGKKADFLSLPEWWEAGKSQIRDISIKFACKKSKERKQYQRNTLRKIQCRNNSGDVKRFQDLKAKLQEIELNTAKG
jgi:hypothetical protein